MTGSRSTFDISGRDLLVALGATRASKRLRLAAGLRDAIRVGRLGPHTRLPASRTLAVDLDVSRGVVVDAYDQLIAEGYLVARRGSGTMVAPQAQRPTPNSHASDEITAFDYDFRPGLPDLESFPRGQWIAALRRVIRDLPNADLGYGPSAGAPVLREALTAYLGRVRGVVADPERVVVTTGAAQGMTLLLRVLQSRGHRVVAVEDPGSPEIRGLVRAAGLEARPVPVDAEGIRVSELIAADASAVLVTPAHQLPMGVVLSAARRHALLTWATARDGLIVEDDYDAEYRYDRQPVGTLQGLAPDRVAYVGTVSKTLAPALRMGWLVLPSSFRTELIELKRTSDLHSPLFEQLALADLIETGAFDRHIRRTRQLYKTRRDRLVASLSRYVRIGGIAAGQHAVLDLPPDCDEARLIEAGARRSLGLYGLARFRLADGPPGLVIGYARCPEFRMDKGLELLRRLLIRPAR